MKKITLLFMLTFFCFASFGQFYNVVYTSPAGGTEGAYNSFLGYDAGYHNTGSKNSFLGCQAGFTNEGYRNTFIGYATGCYNKGDYNTFIGGLSGYWNTLGRFNTFIGKYLSTISFNFIVFFKFYS